MTQQSSFKEAKKAYMKNLKQYVPVVERVHGGHHPEFHEVRRLFDSMVARMSEAGRKHPALQDVFQQLRKVTDNYTVSDDVCESYEAVYQMLSKLDHAYNA